VKREELFQNRDYTLSPFSGLTRQHWLQAARMLLEGIFSHVKNPENPVVTVRREMEITYPHPDASPQQQAAERKAQIFEGLARSFLIASVMIHEEPDLTVCGICLREYYKKHILLSCTVKDHSEYVGTYEEMQEMTGHQDPFRPFQQTVETCALVIGLWACREEIWAAYTIEERNLLAAFLSEYAHANTVPQNWRLFNMLDLAFLNMEGYPIDRTVMRDHAQAVLGWYAGDGWYRDGHSFDYYSCWAFSFYAPLWNLWYGYSEEPVIAGRFEENSNTLMKTFPDFFDRDGFVNMWGRSSIYRNAVTSAFDGNFFLKNSCADPGLARRICSGSLLQFMERDDFLWEGIPTLGFYGQFTPLVQRYSCAESVFWLGKAFLCLHLSADHPFWTARENNGSWDHLEEKQVKETCLPGPALAFSNHQANGETILRTGKVVKQKGDTGGIWAYGKLCYSTKYPWESSPNAASPDEGGCLPFRSESMQYVIQDLPTVLTEEDSFHYGNVIFWGGEKDHVLYRRQYFDYVPEKECHWIQGMDLADFTVPCGIMRVDKLRLFRRPVRITLGAFGFPDNGTVVERKSLGKAHAVILKGKDHMGRCRAMAMTIYDGWEKLEIIKSKGSNPDSLYSLLVCAVTDRHRQYDGSEPYVLISQVITRNDGRPFSDEELFPVKEILYEDGWNTGAFGKILLRMKDGTERTINFDRMEGKLSL